MDYLDRIPEGYSEAWYDGSKYAVRKESFSGQRSIKFYAEELGGNDFVSANVYLTRGGELFRPCEMPSSKVRDFLENLSYDHEHNKREI